MELDDLWSFVLTTVVALPLTFLWTDGIGFIAGVVYAVFYTVLMLAPTAIMVLMIFDAVRVITGRRTSFMPVFLATVRRSNLRKNIGPDRSIGHLLARLGVVANPLVVLVREIWILALRLRGDGIERMERDSRDVTDPAPG